MGKILQIRLAALAREEDVVLSPEDDRLGLLLSEELLPLRVELYVRPIIIEKVELDPSRVGPIEIMQIHVPVVWTDELRSAVTVSVDQLDRVGLQECFEWLLGLGRPALPIGAAQTVPYGGKTDFVGVGVLNDQPFEPVRPPCDDAEAHRPSVVLNVESEAGKPGFPEKRFDDLGCPVKGVGELRRIGHVRVAESRIVRRDHMKPVGERRYQIAILV